MLLRATRGKANRAYLQSIRYICMNGSGSVFEAPSQQPSSRGSYVMQ
jgi:hypothetical protein